MPNSFAVRLPRAQGTCSPTTCQRAVAFGRRGGQGSKSRSARDPSKRKQLIPGSFAVPVKDNVLLRLVKEGKAADPDEAPFSCNYLKPGILERLVHYMPRSTVSAGKACLMRSWFG